MRYEFSLNKENNPNKKEHEVSYWVDQKDRAAELRDIREGWDAIRGPSSNWNQDSELLEIEHYNLHVELFGDEYFSYIRARDALNKKPETDEVTIQHLCLRSLEARQVSLLDAVRSCSMIGRPVGSSTLLRSMYETYLAILLLVFHEGEIDKSLLKNPKHAEVFLTAEDLAQAFWEFGHHARLSIHETLIERGVELDDERGTLALHNLGDAARTKYGFSTSNNSWHPFKGIWHIRNHLWPSTNAIFPKEVFPFPKDIWLSLFTLCYKEPSHDVHSSSASHVKRELDETDGYYLLAKRSWDATPFQFALTLTDITMLATSHHEGLLDTWQYCRTNIFGWYENDPIEDSED